ncbi:MAG: ZIP family metal transporter, partial [Treponema sp.]|nr:ZIP family metal transporter [Treponema sp.]
MNNYIITLFGLLVPFLGTTLGSSCVFFMKGQMNEKIQKFLLGFASGVMIAASVWSLIIPSMEMSANMGKFSVVPAACGIALGMAFLLLLDRIIPHLHATSTTPEGLPSKLKKTIMLVFAVTLHNIPEGMAIGVVWSGLLSKGAIISIPAAFALSIGIAIQNFPEGAIISMPLRSEGNGKLKSFALGTLSGIVEPIAAILTIVLSSILVPILPWF